MRLLAALVLSLACLGASAQSAATYRVTFDATWSATTHPGAYPPNAHFSPPVGATHDASVALWAPGGLASPGVEQMAETGATTLLHQEIAAAGGVGQRLDAAAFFSPGQIETTFTVTDAHPLVTYVTMVAPSPDWFVGVHGVDLRDATGQWAESVVVPLHVYDAGTDSGEAFTSPDLDTQPRQPIARLTAPPFQTDTPLGTFTFSRLSVAGESSPDALVLTLTVANPARAGAALRLSAPTTAEATVEIVSITGRRVTTLYAGPGGMQTLALPALPAGAYAVRATSGTARVVRLVTVVR